MREHGVDHYCGAPIVHNMIIDAPAELRDGVTQKVRGMVAAAAPPAAMIEGMANIGFDITHVYGLTETYGPHTVCQWQVGWEDEDAEARARLLSRQGVAMVMADPIRVVDEGGRDVPRDGVTVGEIVMSGNNVMKGYFADPDATATAFRGGVFHSGDLGVHHPDGYVELRDRAKDVVVSGGENISTIEVEQAIVSHPGVLEAAVIGIPDDKWGERPKAFVVARPGVEPPAAEDLASHVRERLAGYKCPDRFELLDELPRTSTGKVRKYELREREWAGRESRIN
jgi:fatty-acyl-CoA synthase